MEKTKYKFKKVLIYESKTNMYICRYIFDNEIIDFKILNDHKCFMKIVLYWRKIDEKIKLDFIKQVHWHLLQLPTQVPK